MKARVLRKQPKIVMMYNLNYEKAAEISRICVNNGVRPLELDTTSAAFSVGYLGEYEGYSGDFVKCDIPQNEAVVFSALTGSEVNAILSEMKSKGVTVELKGMVTETNKSWGLGKLISEFVEEKERLSK